MTIETKFDISDKIFFISNKKSHSSIIRGIKVDVAFCPIETNIKITYLCNEDSDARVHIKIEEEDAYKTKEELLQSI